MKNLKHIVFLFILLLLVTSCGKDDEPSTPPPPQNTAPELVDQSFTVAENITDTTVIGTITATDAEEDALTYNLTTNSNDLFVLTQAGELGLATGKLLNYDVAETHNLTVEVTDGTNTTEATITISITNTVDVYVVGISNSGINENPNVATLWKNGEPIALSNQISAATAIYILEDDVYVTGWEDNGTNRVATIWRNGEPTHLSDKQSQGNDIYVAGDDIYVAGSERDENNDRFAKFWKNDLIFSIGGVGSEAHSITVDYDNNVHVATDEYNAMLWSSFLPTELSDGPGEANVVKSVGNAIYVGGQGSSDDTGTYVATVWRNGVATELSTTYGEVYDMKVAGGNLHMVGYARNNLVASDLPMYWINDAVTTPFSDASVRLKAIDIFNEDVYILGEKNGVATLWINGEATALTDETNSRVNDVFVKL